MKGLCCYILFLYNERVVLLYFILVYLKGCVVIFYSCIMKGLCYYILLLYIERVVLYFIIV